MSRLGLGAGTVPQVADAVITRSVRRWLLAEWLGLSSDWLELISTKSQTLRHPTEDLAFNCNPAQTAVVVSLFGQLAAAHLLVQYASRLLHR